MSYSKGLPQVIEYGSSSTNLYYTVTNERGLETKPDSAPTIAIYDPSGTALVAATAMTALTSGERMFLAYDAQTVEFQDGELVTGAAGATGIIIGQTKGGSAGVLALSNVDGTFVNNEALTGSSGGSATVDGVLYAVDYKYSVNASNTTTYDLGQNYYAKVVYAISSVTFNRYVYFDVAYYPMITPIVSSNDVDMSHPTWLGMRPSAWPDWSNAISRAHADLVRMIHSNGEQAAHYVKRESDLYKIEMAFVEAAIAESIGLIADERDYYLAKKSKVWASRGEMVFSESDDGTITEASHIGRIRVSR